MKLIPELPKDSLKKGLPKFTPFKPKEKKVKPQNPAEDEPIQLDLGLKESPLNKLYTVRSKLDKLEDRIKLSQYWRNPLIWITILFPLTMCVIFFKYYVTIIDLIPDNIPLIRLNNDLSTLFLPKFLIIIIPVSILIFSIITSLLFRLSYRKLEKFVFVNMLFFISLSIISYSIVWRITRIFV